MNAPANHERLSWPRRIGWAMGDLGINFYWQGITIFGYFFYTDVMGIAPFWAGIAYAVASFWDAVTDPVMGAIADRTRNGGAEIVKLLKTGSAYYAPAMSAVEMVEAILTDQKRMVPCSVLLEGEYQLKNLFIGVPVLLGGKGVEKIIELPLSDDEKGMLAKSAASVQSIVDVVNKSA